MLTRKFMTRLALALGMGTALVLSASSASMAQSLANGGNYAFEPGNNGSVWSNDQSYNDNAGRAYCRAENDGTVRPTGRSNCRVAYERQHTLLRGRR
jgi:hypothetical protein